MVSLLLLALALRVASASPLSGNRLISRGAVTGTNTGSIYSLGPEAEARQILWVSGSCGLSTYFPTVAADAKLVAMPDIVMLQHGASQHNELCGKEVVLKQAGVDKNVTVVVADTNFSKEHSIDMTMASWEAFGRNPQDADNKDFSLDWSIEM
jgi:hypothetical protein